MISPEHAESFVTGAEATFEILALRNGEVFAARTADASNVREVAAGCEQSVEVVADFVAKSEFVSGERKVHGW